MPPGPERTTAQTHSRRADTSLRPAAIHSPYIPPSQSRPSTASQTSALRFSKAAAPLT